jgi:transcriptional regulator with XRE-family HTH domain
MLTFVSDKHQEPTGPNRLPSLPGEPDPDGAFAQCLRAAREAARLTQQQVADKMSGRGYPMRQNTISTIEGGSRLVWLGEAVALADIVGVSLTELLAAPGDTDLQKAVAAVSGAERNVRRRQDEVAKASAVAEQAQAELGMAEAALDAARQQLRYARKHVVNPHPDSLPPLDPYARGGSTDPYEVPRPETRRK